MRSCWGRISYAKNTVRRFSVLATNVVAVFVPASVLAKAFVPRSRRIAMVECEVCCSPPSFGRRERTDDGTGPGLGWFHPFRDFVRKRDHQGFTARDLAQQVRVAYNTPSLLVDICTISQLSSCAGLYDERQHTRARGTPVLGWLPGAQIDKKFTSLSLSLSSAPSAID